MGGYISQACLGHVGALSGLKQFTITLCSENISLFCDELRYKENVPEAGAAVTIMAICALSLSNSFSSAVIFFRASGSVAFFTDLVPLGA